MPGTSIVATGILIEAGFPMGVSLAKTLDGGFYLGQPKELEFQNREQTVPGPRRA
jgi:hypothetical protein